METGRLAYFAKSSHAFLLLTADVWEAGLHRIKYIMRLSFFRIVVILAAVILFSCNNKSNNNSANDEKVIIVNSSEDVGKMGTGHYINTNTEYRDRDGVRHSRDDIWAPREGESASDASYRESMRVLEGSGQEDQYEEGYKDGYNAAKSELEN